MTQDTIKLIKQYISVLTENGVKVDKAYLFGSQVKGSAHAWSDIDTCIVSSDFGSSYFDTRVKLLKLTKNVSWAIEPHPFSVEDFNDRHNSMANEIKRTGVRVV